MLLIKKHPCQGFTLIELMVVLTIIGILSAVAMPAYRNMQVKSRITEGISLAGAAKGRIADSNNNLTELSGAASSFNVQSGGKGATSKYVVSVLVDEATGEIVVTYDAVALKSSDITNTSNTIVLSPWVKNNTTLLQLGDALSQGITGSLDWSCGSDSHQVAASRSMIPVLSGTLPARFAPAECR